MKLTYDDYLEGTVKVLRDSEKEKEKYSVVVLGEKFVVYPNVFSPKYFFDTEFFAKEIPIKKGEEFLEIGPGTGIVSIFAVLKGAAKVFAVDINPAAIENTKENAKLHKVEDRLEVLEGDIYEPLPEGVKFDTIFWNTPFGYLDDQDITVHEKAVFDPEYKSITRFIRDAKKYLKEGGHVLIGFSTSLGKFNILEGLLKDAGFSVRLLAEVDSVETHPVKFELFEAIPI